MALSLVAMIGLEMVDQLISGFFGVRKETIDKNIREQFYKIIERLQREADDIDKVNRALESGNSKLLSDLAYASPVSNTYMKMKDQLANNEEAIERNTTKAAELRAEANRVASDIDKTNRDYDDGLLKNIGASLGSGKNAFSQGNPDAAQALDRALATSNTLGVK
jgi:small-conductance mechanosensitive channel